jgi:hypothetical protein
MPIAQEASRVVRNLLRVMGSQEQHTQRAAPASDKFPGEEKDCPGTAAVSAARTPSNLGRRA